MRQIEKIGCNLIWKIGWTSCTPYCRCGQKLTGGDEGERDNYCRKCGEKIEWYYPDEYAY